jgi:signal transduction histidine kinase
MKIKILLSGFLFVLTISVFGQSNLGIDSLENILKIAKADTAKVNILNELSTLYRKIEDFKMSKQYAEFALELALTLDHNKGIYESYSNTVQACRRSECPDLLNIIFDYLKIFEENGDKRGISSCNMNIGNMYRGRGNYPGALEKYLISLKISEEIGNKNIMAGSYTNIAGIYQEYGNYQSALENRFAALKIFEETGNKIGISSCYNDLGTIYSDMGQNDEALEKYFASLKIKQEIGFKIGMGNSYNNIGNIYQKQGNYEEALKNHFAALKIREEIGHKYGIAGSYNELGKIYLDKGNYPEARKYLEKGLALAKKINRKTRIRNSYKSLSKLDSIAGNFAQALEHYKMFALYKDSLFNDKSDKRIAQLNIQYETEKKDKEIELLNKDNEIKALQLDKQKASFLATRLEAEKNQNELLLQNNLQQLDIADKQKALEQQQADAKIKETQLELSNKENELKAEQLERQKLIQKVMIAGTVLLLLVGLLLYRSLRLRKKLEKQEAIIQERKRISADLHDDVGSGLSRIMLLSEMVKNEAQIPEARNDAEKISSISQELSSNISEIIWALNSNNDYMKNTVAYIRHYAAEYFDNTPVNLKVTTPDEINDIPIRNENRRNIFYTVKEALHNIIKHAKATEARMDFAVEDNILSVVIQDNGIGMPKGENNPFGNGLKNMYQRMKNSNGEMKIENHQGTKIKLSLPV